jgi:cupin fold WbuC family metalloprotein
MKFSDWAMDNGSFAAIEADTCERLFNDAVQAPRKRSHLLLHESHSDPAQRLLVAFARGTYIQPHCHPEQWELVVPMRGTLAMLTFSTDGQVISRTELTANSVPALQISAGTIHTLIAVTPFALMLEIKPGPFRPAQFFDSFPTENAAGATRAAAWLLSATEGSFFESDDSSRGQR